MKQEDLALGSTRWESSIITGITIFVSGQHAQAAEMTQSSSDFNEQSQQTEQVEHKEDTTHLSYELNQEAQLANQRLIKRTNLMAMYKKE